MTGAVVGGTRRGKTCLAHWRWLMMILGKNSACACGVRVRAPLPCALLEYLKQRNHLLVLNYYGTGPRTDDR
jgi:hypothetical protein